MRKPRCTAHVSMGACLKPATTRWLTADRVGFRCDEHEAPSGAEVFVLTENEKRAA